MHVTRKTYHVTTNTTIRPAFIDKMEHFIQEIKDIKTSYLEVFTKATKLNMQQPNKQETNRYCILINYEII
jgi:hypothetical protein